MRVVGLVCMAMAIFVVGRGAVRAEGPAIGQFELKDLEAGSDYMQFQSQNAYAWGQPRRQTATGDDGEARFDENSVVRQRHALEVEMGLSRHLKFRLGIEFEKERVEEPLTIAQANAFGDLNLSEIGGEVIGILVPRDGDGVGLGVVVEAEHPIGGGEPNAVIMGTIMEFASGPWSASLIPMGVHHFGGPREVGEARDDKWDFAYAAQALYELSATWTFGVEAYGTVDRIGSTGHRSEANLTFGDFDQHRLGPIVYYTLPLSGSGKPAAKDDDAADGEEEGTTATLGIGYFVGLNDNTPDGTAKVSLEVDF